MTTPLICPACKAEVESDARFCQSCGALLVAETATIPVLIGAHDLSKSAAESTSLPSGVVALVVDRGPDSGTRFLLTAPQGLTMTIGRDSDSDIFLDDVTVSRRHATVTGVNGHWVIADAGSLNGTYVNGERCAERSLEAGDLIYVGKFRFVVTIGGSE